MRKLASFNFISLDGYFKGANEDISWSKHDPEGSAYAMEGLKSGSTLLFGRVTYQMMAAFWTSADAIKNDPVLSGGMNNADKIVFSRTLSKAEWNKTMMIKDNIVEEIKKLRQATGNDMTILGSGSIVAQFAEHGLIDEFQILVNPVVLATGTPLFKGINNKLDLKLKSTRTFGNGNVLLCYEP